MNLLSLRASSRDYQILLCKSYVLPTSKKICQVKKSPSPIIWHNSLANPKYNLHQESERETKLCLCPSTLWKLTSRTWDRNKIIFMPFHLFWYGRMRRGYERTYIRARRLFFRTWYKWQPGMGNCWRRFFLFLPTKQEVRAFDLSFPHDASFYHWTDTAGITNIARKRRHGGGRSDVHRGQVASSGSTAMLLWRQQEQD